MKYVLIPVLPLIAFVINIILGRRYIKDKAHWISVPAVIGSFILSTSAFIDVLGGKVINVDLYSWIVSGDFRVSIGFLIDQLTVIMLMVVTSISSLIFIYSIGYMHGDKGYYRFFAYLSLFVFSMLMLVMANNFLLLYLGWEAVGLCSYFLIGFWFEKKSASDAGKKAFITCRFGDFAFAIGIIMIFLNFGTLHYPSVFADVENLAGKTVNLLGYDIDLITIIALLLFAGAVGKSAQIPLHVWLPDAMEGPTPVSALIHAATMVTAGVFMVARCSPIFNLSPVAMETVAIIGAITSVFAGTIAMVQNDIKRIIAYSTISHLGMMFTACGVGAYAAGIFHLYSHAFFKALLFLCSGSVIHVIYHNDIQRMGGLKKYMPVTYITMFTAALSAGGFPGLAGFFSKDEIIWSAFASDSPVGGFVLLLLMIGAFLTPFYSFRMIFLTFHGRFRGSDEERHHLHESPPVMTIPLILLSIGAVASGWVGIPELLGGGAQFAEFLRPVLGHPELHGIHAQQWGVMGLSTIIALSGIVVATILYIIKTHLPVRFAQNLKGIYRILFNKYYVDELYNFMIIRPAIWIADSFIERFTDAKIIEGIVNGVPKSIGRFSGTLRRVQSGFIGHYALIMAAGIIIIIALILW